MSLVDEFPADPYHPSLRYAASNQMPITVPWTTQPVRLGSSFRVSHTNGGQSQFSDKTAFSKSALQLSQLSYTRISSGELIEASSIGSASCAEHVNFSVAGSIGGSFLGVSGQAQYEKQVMNNDNSIKQSLRSTYRNGKMAFDDLPALSAEARSLLLSSPKPYDAFVKEYGEYFVAAYILGASNANMLGSASTSAASLADLSGSYTVKVLFFETTNTFGEHSATTSGVQQASLSAFDSLQDYSADMKAPGQTSYAQLMNAAAENARRSWTMQQRLEEKAKSLGLDMRQPTTLSWQKCESVCRAGVVVELLLMPYIGLRSFKEAIWSGPTS